MGMNKRFLIAVGLVVAAPATAYANCDTPSQYWDGDFRPDYSYPAGCTAQQNSREVQIHLNDAVSRALATSFGLGPDEMMPAGMTGLSEDEALKRLVGGNGIHIDPTADVPAAAPSPKWNSWLDGKYTWNDNGDRNFDLDGPLFNGLLGVDYKLTSKVTLGLLGSVEASHYDGDGVDTRSSGVGGGAYVGIMLTDNIVFSANTLLSDITTKQSGDVRYEGPRWQTSGAVTGYWYKDNWRFTPAVSISWSKEWMNAKSGPVTDQTVETAALTPSIQIGKTLHLSDKTTMEPWAGAALDYTFLSRTKPEGLDASNDPNADLRVQVGLNFGFGSNAQLALTAEAGGLLNKDLNTYSGEANLAIQF